MSGSVSGSGMVTCAAGEVFRPHWGYVLLRAGILLFWGWMLESVAFGGGPIFFAINLLAFVGSVYRLLERVSSFIRIDSEGVAWCRIAGRVRRIRWEEIEGVTFGATGLSLPWMEIRRPGLDSVNILLNVYSKKSRKRMAELIGARVGVETKSKMDGMPGFSLLLQGDAKGRMR